ncbi:MAG: slipin family protein [Deltaproteobacteria bacterium]|nr:slipin family protein [Deltaproteobacteria bacterium]
MLVFKRIKVRSYEKGLVFREGEFAGLLHRGKHWILDPLHRQRVELVSMRETWLRHPKLDLIVASGALEGLAEVVDLDDKQRGLVWVDGRFESILEPGLYALWTGQHEVRVEIADARAARFEHAELATLIRSPGAERQLAVHVVPEGQVGLFYLDGKLEQVAPPGRYAFWKAAAELRVFMVDVREIHLDIAGQEILSADNVTLRLNAQLSYRVIDPRKAVQSAPDFSQALYRQAQLALREVVGTRTLESLLADKESVSAELERDIRARAERFGVEVLGLGIRDIILPGEMRDLLNRVTEARKAAEAALITRREETAAMRSQLNTARLVENNPTLMRMRELEVLEKIAKKAKLNVVLGEKGLAERVVNLL